MYISGQLNDFESRCHQLVTGDSDVTAFAAEGNYYLGTFPVSIQGSGKWEFELRRRQYLISQDPTDLFNQILGAGGNQDNLSGGLPNPSAVDISSIAVLLSSDIILQWDVTDDSLDGLDLAVYDFTSKTYLTPLDGSNQYGNGDIELPSLSCPGSYQLALVISGDGMNYNAVTVTGAQTSYSC